jgi:menaquinone-dependent protoporphyrinogen oxidase
MSNKILVTYASESGSTAEIAQTIQEQLAKNETQVDVKSIKEVQDITGYDAVVIGGPMIIGWHRDATGFVEQHAETLGNIPVAFFFTSLNLTLTGEDKIGTTPLYFDPTHGTAPKNPAKLSFKEKHGVPAKYLNPVLEKAPQVKPVSAAFFGGKLDYSRLSLPGWLFVKLIVRGKDGDYRNWDAIRDWTASIGQALL